MATVTKLQAFGNQMVVLYSDGTRQLAYPTGSGLWLVGGSATPSGEWVWPFAEDTWNINNGHPEDGFRTIGRPSHNGFDMGFGIANITGTPIKSSTAGSVIDLGSGGSFGNWVEIQYGNFTFLYAHMFNPPLVGIGDPITVSQHIGGIGTTGGSTGNHLHYEIFDILLGDQVDPIIFMSSHNPSNLVAA